MHMKRYASTLPPTKIDLNHHEALEKLADKLQTSASQLTRQAIAELLAKHGVNLSNNSERSSHE